MGIRTEKKALSTNAAIAIIAVVIGLAAIAGVYYIWFSHSHLKTENFSFKDFTSLEVTSAFKVTITQSNNYSIKITANQNMFDQIEVTKTGSTLKIDTLPGAIIGTFIAEAKITMPNITSIKLSGATHITAQGFNSQTTFEAELYGASTLELTNFQAGYIATDISGASTLTATGTAKDLAANVTGGSNLNLQNFAINNANLIINGASHAAVNLNETLNADVAGASTLEYAGQATIGNVNSSDGSTITKK